MQNRARQRRLYLSVAHSWHERATSAFSARDLEGFRWTHALRLDCLLEASLAAYDLNLCPPAEYAQSLWWIQRMSAVRCKLEHNWWSEVWMHIASGLLKKLSSRPLAGASSRDQFLLRHKWARKTPYPKKGRGLVPRWDDWKSAEALYRQQSVSRRETGLISAIRRRKLRSGDGRTPPRANNQRPSSESARRTETKPARVRGMDKGYMDVYYAVASRSRSLARNSSINASPPSNSTSS